MSIFKDGVAIIGAGIAGPALALALHEKNIPCRLYEKRSAADADVLSSGVVISPNGCKVLDQLHILERISSRSYRAETTVIKNDENETVRKVEVAPERLYGYKYHRLYRLILLQEMKAMMEQKNIPVIYGAKFESIVSDTEEGVEFIVNGRVERAAILIGADGIHSSVREHITDQVPQYTGLVCVYGHIPTSSVEWPDDDFKTGCTIQGKGDAIFMVPETADGSDLMVGIQLKHELRDRAQWDSIASDNAQLTALIRQSHGLWKGVGKNLIDQLCKQDKLLCWPYFLMPKLPSWSSATGRVTIIADAAHAMPASSGQGVNQALEDIYSLARVLARADASSKDLPRDLEIWHAWRQQKLDAVIQMMNMTNQMRTAQGDKAGPASTPHALVQWINRLHLEELDALLNAP